ncbi:hypothetical protein B0H17DRAFT_1140337 [Mycena rosella]|uniref:Uncharacterized protein n=1 Tax=Mycena rosella TaxID=1033263 RepID=A0AAD7G7T4_MYCRO|nr:hypothetical protein B0H17DRAFT_1140337 [Mycena rosella]
MDTANLASLLLQLLAGNTQPLLAAAATGQASQPPAANTPAVLVASPPQTLPPATIHPSSAPQPLATTQIQPYQSLRAAPSVLLPPLPPLSSSSASTNLSSVVNQAQLSHSASSLPRQPTLTRRRPRTSAVAPPSLPRTLNISSCMTTVGGQPHLRTMNYIYPPQIGDSESDLYLMRFLKDTFLKTMREMGLVVLQTSPVSLALTDHIISLVQELRGRQIDILEPSSTSLLVHEEQPLIPLYVVNRGVPCPSDNQIRLRQSPVRPSCTIAEIAANRLQFAIPGLCIDTVEGLIIFASTSPNLTATFALPGPGQVPRPHHCLSQRLYTMFPRDRVHEQWLYADGDSSCGESDDDSNLGLELGDNDDWENLPHSPTPRDIPTRASVLRSSRAGDTQPTAPRAILQSPTSPNIPALPAAIWNNQWHPHSEVIHDSYQEDALCLAATSGTHTRSVMYKGESVSEAADDLLGALGRCVNDGDFTSVLSDDQTAIMPVYESGTQTIVSSGEGILHEVVHAAFIKTLTTTGPQWLTPRSDGKLSILFVRSLGFGSYTLWALMMIKGFAVDPIDVALLQFLFHDCNLHSLHPTFLSEWHPIVKNVLDHWKAGGPDGDVNIPLIASHLATFHNIEVSAVSTRDRETHEGLLVEMLYRSVIGSEPPLHPDLVALSRGFWLPCRNGFTFTQFIRSVLGGSDTFLVSVMTSVVGPLTLLSHISISPAPNLSELIRAAMGGESFTDILTDYFMGAGIPWPEAFKEAKHHFPDVVDLSLIDKPHFRAQI